LFVKLDKYQELQTIAKK